MDETRRRANPDSREGAVNGSNRRTPIGRRPEPRDTEVAMFNAEGENGVSGCIVYVECPGSAELTLPLRGVTTKSDCYLMWLFAVSSQL